VPGRRWDEAAALRINTIEFILYIYSLYMRWWRMHSHWKLRPAMHEMRFQEKLMIVRRIVISKEWIPRLAFLPSNKRDAMMIIYRPKSTKRIRSPRCFRAFTRSVTKLAAEKAAKAGSWRARSSARANLPLWG
jgi:hypothetical protein